MQRLFGRCVVVQDMREGVRNAPGPRRDTTVPFVAVQDSSPQNNSFSRPPSVHICAVIWCPSRCDGLQRLVLLTSSSQLASRCAPQNQPSPPPLPGRIPPAADAPHPSSDLLRVAAAFSTARFSSRASQPRRHLRPCRDAVPRRRAALGPGSSHASRRESAPPAAPDDELADMLQTRRANRGGYADHDDFEGPRASTPSGYAWPPSLTASRPPRPAMAARMGARGDAAAAGAAAEKRRLGH